MTFCSRQVRVHLRVQAGVWLFTWVAALVACSLVCIPFTCDESTACQTSHSGNPGTPSSSSDHDEDPSPRKNGSDQGFCSSVQDSRFASGNPIVAAIPFKALIDAHTVLTAVDSFSATYILRRVKECHRVFTPEVCLGPAFRSLAPPLSA